MRKKVLFLSLLSFAGILSSCVDSKYDLADIDTDDISVGGTWVAPLGSGFIETEDLININKVSSVKLESDGSYVARYEGVMQPVTRSLRANGNMTEVAVADVNTNDLQELFDDDFVLDLVDPHIQLRTKMTQGSVDTRLNLTAVKGSREEPTSAEFPLSGNQPYVWIGAHQPAGMTDYLFVKNDDLSQLISIVPETMRMSLKVDASQAATLPQGSFDNIEYVVEAPLMPAPGFKGIATERISDAFDESIVSYLFENGTATIYGEVTNEMPFDLLVEMIILDANENPLDISFPMQEVTGEEGKVEFVINEKDMPKMVNACHMSMQMHLSGREQVDVLKKGQRVTLNLKIKKEGGISI